MQSRFVLTALVVLLLAISGNFVDAKSKSTAVPWTGGGTPSSTSVGHTSGSTSSSEIVSPSPTTRVPTPAPKSASAPSLVASVCAPVVGALAVIFW